MLAVRRRADGCRQRGGAAAWAAFARGRLCTLAPRAELHVCGRERGAVFWCGHGMGMACTRWLRWRNVSSGHDNGGDVASAAGCARTTVTTRPSHALLSLHNDHRSRDAVPFAPSPLAALSMPVHWYYNPADIRADYGVIDRYLAPRERHPSSILHLSSTGGCVCQCACASTTSQRRPVVAGGCAALPRAACSHAKTLLAGPLQSDASGRWGGHC